MNRPTAMAVMATVLFALAPGVHFAQEPSLQTALHILPPVAAETGSVATLDRSLTQYLAVTVCAPQAEGVCTPIKTFARPGCDPRGYGCIGLEVDNYHVNWRATTNRVQLRFSVADLAIGMLDYQAKLGSTIPIRFMVDNNPRIRVRVLHAQGATATGIGQVLVSEFGLVAQDSALLLRLDNFGAVDIGLALRDVFGLHALQSAPLLKSLGFGATEIATDLRGPYALGASDATQLLYEIGFDPVQLGLAMKNAYGLAPEGTAAVLRAGGLGNLQVTQAMREAYSLSAGAAATVLRNLGLTAAEVALALNSHATYSLDVDAMSLALREANFSSSETGLVLHESFELDASATAMKLKVAGYSPAETEVGLQAIFGRLNPEAMARIVVSVYEHDDPRMVGWACAPFSAQARAEALANKAAGVLAIDEALSRKNACGGYGPGQTATWLHRGGWGASESALAIAEVYGLDAEGVALAMKAGFWPFTAIGSALTASDGFGLPGASATEILERVFGVDAYQAARRYAAEGAPPEVIRDTLGNRKFEAAIAYRWAPIHTQGRHVWGYNAIWGEADKITNVNFDGDWDPRNNWDKAAEVPMLAHAYYSVVESPTHFFIVYSFYHARDWVRDNILDGSEHHNDFEGCLALVHKDGSLYGHLELLITIAHGNMPAYAVLGSHVTAKVDRTWWGIVWMSEYDQEMHPQTIQAEETHALYALDPIVHVRDEYSIEYLPSLVQADHVLGSWGQYKLVNLFAPEDPPPPFSSDDLSLWDKRDPGPWGPGLGYGKLASGPDGTCGDPRCEKCEGVPDYCADRAPTASSTKCVHDWACACTWPPKDPTCTPNAASLPWGGGFGELSRNPIAYLIGLFDYESLEINGNMFYCRNGFEGTDSVCSYPWPGSPIPY